jgi:hypothetical protein
VRVERAIDLDAVAAAVQRRGARWIARGMTVGQLTWVDGQTTVNELTTHREAVRGDYSVGVRVRRGDEEGQLVVYAGGWCDLEFWAGRADCKPLAEAPGADEPLDMAGLEVVLDRFEGLFQPIV